MIFPSSLRPIGPKAVLGISGAVHYLLSVLNSSLWDSQSLHAGKPQGVFLIPFLEAKIKTGRRSQRILRRPHVFQVVGVGASRQQELEMLRKMVPESPNSVL